MDPFCDVAGYRARYPDDETADEVLLECLTEATDLISAELDAYDVEYADPSESFTYRLARVCRTVARRALGGAQDGGIPFGATQLSEGAGQFSASVQLANPYGDLFLTEQERRSLGIGGMLGAVLSPYG